MRSLALKTLSMLYLWRVGLTTSFFDALLHVDFFEAVGKVAIEAMFELSLSVSKVGQIVGDVLPELVNASFRKLSELRAVSPFREGVCPNSPSATLA